MYQSNCSNRYVCTTPRVDNISSLNVDGHYKSQIDLLDKDVTTVTSSPSVYTTPKRSYSHEHRLENAFVIQRIAIRLAQLLVTKSMEKLYFTT